jgi:hypothetical protein
MSVQYIEFVAAADFPIGTATADPSVAGDDAEQLVAAMLDKVKI